MDSGGEHWNISDNIDQDDQPFLTLPSTGTLQVNHFPVHIGYGSSPRGAMSHIQAMDTGSAGFAQGNSSAGNTAHPPSAANVMQTVPSHGMFQPADNQMIGMGNANAAGLGGSGGMDQYQPNSNLLYRAQLHALAVASSRQQVASPYQGGSSVHRPAGQSAVASMMPPLHMTRPHGMEQNPTAQVNANNLLYCPGNGVQQFEQTIPASNVTFTEMLMKPPGNDASTNASLLSSGSLNNNQFGSSRTMQANAMNRGIGSGNYNQLGDPNTDPWLQGGGRAKFQQPVENNARTWMNSGQSSSTPQLRTSLEISSSSNAPSEKKKMPIMNSVYDPMYERMGLPIDPHLRMFLAEQAREKAKKSAENKRK